MGDVGFTVLSSFLFRCFIYLYVLFTPPTKPLVCSSLCGIRH